MDDLLKYAAENGILDMDSIQKAYDMKKRDEMLSRHQWAISQGKDGYYRTYLPDKDKGRRMVKKKSREDIENVVIAYIKDQEVNPTVQEVFDEWNDRRLELKKISSATHIRIIQIFNKHFSELKNRKIKSLEPDEIQDFLEEQISKYQLSAKGFSNLKAVAKGMLKRAKKRKLVDYDVVTLFQELDTSDSEFKKTIKEDCYEVFDEEELPKMIGYLVNNLDMRNIGILLMFVTGIRVGELVTLKHSDFEENTFKIRRTETRYKDNENDKKYIYDVKEFPKTDAGVRTAIIPEEYNWLCKKIKALNPFGEYIFYENGKRLTTNCIRRRMGRICNKLNIIPKSPHKARKTYGTILLDSGVDKKLIIDVMGHTDITMTEKHYHRTRRSIERKSEILSQIPEFKVN